MSQKPSSAAGCSRKFLLPVLAGMLLLSSGCLVGPKYQRPSAPGSPAYKEPLPDGWKEARPNDGVIRGDWWEIYHDPELDALEEQVSISNQNVLAAEAQFRAARDAVRIARSALFPTVGASPSVNNSRTSNTLTNNQIQSFLSRCADRLYLANRPLIPGRCLGKYSPQRQGKRRDCPSDRRPVGERSIVFSGGAGARLLSTARRGRRTRLARAHC